MTTVPGTVSSAIPLLFEWILSSKATSATQIVGHVSVDITADCASFCAVASDADAAASISLSFRVVLSEPADLCVDFAVTSRTLPVRCIGRHLDYLGASTGGAWRDVAWHLGEIERLLAVSCL